MATSSAVRSVANANQRRHTDTLHCASQEGFADAHIPVLHTQLNEREAFRAMFLFRQTLEKPESAGVGNIDKAIFSGQQLAAEWSSFSE